jgi:hypothetical protein
MLPNKKQIEGCKHGISSYYYPLNDQWGIKWFKNKRERDSSKYYQHIASLSGLAPKTGNNVYSDGYWGYYTENVDMIHDIYKSRHLIPNRIHKQISNIMDDLVSSCDFEPDANWKNFGIKDGKVVYVDFGFCGKYSYVAR